MAQIIYLPTNEDHTGNLTVFENLLPSGIKRVFFIYKNTSEVRGLHRHKEATHALICPVGNCKILVDSGKSREVFVLDDPKKCLILDPNDWREIYDLEIDSLLLCISNTLYSKEDYIFEPYPTKRNFEVV
jgi:hypothetical protein